MKQQALNQIKNMDRFDVDRLNSIANRTGISLTLAVFYFNATH